MREYEPNIIRTERRGPSTFFIEMECGGIAEEAAPGQFVQVRVSNGTDPFLRRTFSLCGADPSNGTIRLMVDVIGRGTGILCEMRPGMTLNVIGPLGTGFDPRFGKTGDCILVAGGVGAAPLIFLASRLAADETRPVTFLMGSRSAAHLAVLDGMLDSTIQVMRATDDGSFGYDGFVTGLLRERLSLLNPGVVYACGPHPMMREAAKISARAGIPCQVSLEERMACGIGACLGCAVPLAEGGMVRSCTEGPVFDAERLAW